MQEVELERILSSMKGAMGFSSGKVKNTRRR